MKPKLSHVDEGGSARMVDVTDKSDTVRVAVARGLIRMRTETINAIRENSVAKGDVLTVARLAGIMGAKRTSDLIPLCHPLPLTGIEVVLSLDDTVPGVRAQSTATTVGKTGVEMEALTAVAAALLTIYDMTKAIDRDMAIESVELVEKRGGRRPGYRSGSDWVDGDI